MTENFTKLLEEVFEPSPFGHGGKTVLDHSVRKAMQVRRGLLWRRDGIKTCAERGDPRYMPSQSGGTEVSYLSRCMRERPSEACFARRIRPDVATQHQHQRGLSAPALKQLNLSLQVKADRIVSTGVDLEELDILESVRRGLTPNSSRIHASLDKLNLYSKGGVGGRGLVSSVLLCVQTA